MLCNLFRYVRYAQFISLLLFSVTRASEIVSISPVHIENGEEDYHTCLLPDGTKHDYMYHDNAEKKRKEYGLTCQEVLDVLFGTTGVEWNLLSPSPSMFRLYSGYNSRIEKPIHLLSTRNRAVIIGFVLPECIAQNRAEKVIVQN